MSKTCADCKWSEDCELSDFVANECNVVLVKCPYFKPRVESRIKAAWHWLALKAAAIVGLVRIR